jgi:hypothetical protein
MKGLFIVAIRLEQKIEEKGRPSRTRALVPCTLYYVKRQLVGGLFGKKNNTTNMKDGA